MTTFHPWYRFLSQLMLSANKTVSSYSYYLRSYYYSWFIFSSLFLMGKTETADMGVVNWDQSHAVSTNPWCPLFSVKPSNEFKLALSFHFSSGCLKLLKISKQSNCWDPYVETAWFDVTFWSWCCCFGFTWYCTSCFSSTWVFIKGWVDKFMLYLFYCGHSLSNRCTDFIFLQLDEVLLPNPFDRPRAVFMLEVRGIEGQWKSRFNWSIMT